MQHVVWWPMSSKYSFLKKICRIFHCWYVFIQKIYKNNSKLVSFWEQIQVIFLTIDSIKRFFLHFYSMPQKGSSKFLSLYSSTISHALSYKNSQISFAVIILSTVGISRKTSIVPLKNSFIVLFTIYSITTAYAIS